MAFLFWAAKFSQRGILRQYLGLPPKRFPPTGAWSSDIGGRWALGGGVVCVETQAQTSWHGRNGPAMGMVGCGGSGSDHDWSYESKDRMNPVRLHSLSWLRFSKLLGRQSPTTSHGTPKGRSTEPPTPGGRSAELKRSLNPSEANGELVRRKGLRRGMVAWWAANPSIIADKEPVVPTSSVGGTGEQRTSRRADGRDPTAPCTRAFCRKLCPLPKNRQVGRPCRRHRARPRMPRTGLFGSGRMGTAGLGGGRRRGTGKAGEVTAAGGPDSWVVTVRRRWVGREWV